jgi:hypothetical protein
MVAASIALIPAWAMAGNQEVAEQVAANLRESGQLHGYKIGVKCQDGTAWVRGAVSNHEQMNTALNLVLQTPGVTRVVNNLAISEPTEVATPDPQSAAPIPSPSLKQVVADLAQRQPATRVSTSFYSAPVTPVNATSAVEPQPTPAPTLVAPMIQQAPQMIQQAPQIAATAAPQAVAIPMMGAPMYGQPIPVAYIQGQPMPLGQPGAAPMPQYVTPVGGTVAQARHDQPNVPNYAWPSYAAHPNYAGVTYPKQYSPTAWPYIGPFYPYPQVPLGWRKVTLEWHDGWWQLDFDDGSKKGLFSGLFRPCR